MLEFLLTGMGFAFAAAVQPGPLQAFLFGQVAQKGWRPVLPASLAPVMSDAPIALAVLFLLSKIPKVVLGYLQSAGGLLLLYLAWSVYRQSKNKKVNESGKKSEPRTLFQAVAVNLFNPNPYLGWSLVLGPMAIKAWHIDPLYAFILIGSFYITMTSALAATIILFGAAKYMNEIWQKRLIFISGFVLGGIGLYQLAAGIFSVLKK